MAIKGAAGVRKSQGEGMKLDQSNPNGGERMVVAFPKRNKQRMGRQEITTHRDERGELVSAVRNVGVVS